MSQGERSTRRQILLYAVLTVAASALPPVLGIGGTLYAAVCAVSGAALLYLAARLWLANAQEMSRPAKRLFGGSILYLFLLFAALLAERALCDCAPRFPMITPTASPDTASLPPSEGPSSPDQLAADFLKARKRRSAAIAGALFLFVALVFAITIARLGGHVFSGNTLRMFALRLPRRQRCAHRAHLHRRCRRDGRSLLRLGAAVSNLLPGDRELRERRSAHRLLREPFSPAR